MQEHRPAVRATLPRSGAQGAKGAGTDYVNGVYCAMRFVETPIFTTVIRRFLDDDAYRALQVGLLLPRNKGP